MAHVHCMLDTQGCKWHRLCNNYCFSTATMVARTLVNLHWKNKTLTVRYWFWARAGFEEFQMLFCNKKVSAVRWPKAWIAFPLVHGHRIPDFGECVLYNGRYTFLRGVSWLKRCCFICAILLATLLCSFVRVTSGILYQQANYELLKEACFSVFSF